jgi:deoxyribodipyrimidine photolyase-related protein
MQILFADQLGSHFNLDGEAAVVLEATSQFRKRKYHRQKAHLILSAIRHRAAAGAELVAVDSLRDYQPGADAKVVNPSSRPMRELARHWGVDIEPARGFVATEADFSAWSSTRGKRLLLEDFYRWQRSRLGILIEPDSAVITPLGGRWNFDQENRNPPPKANNLGIPAPFAPVEDEIDERVRWDLNRLAADGVEFLGADGPRKFAVTSEESAEATRTFFSQRLTQFGPYEDAMMSGDWAMSHSLLSVPLNVGLIDPLQLVRQAEDQLKQGAPLESVEAFIRQILGWRDFVWHLYWQFGPDYLESNYLEAQAEVPESWRNLDSSTIQANCVRNSISDLSENGWLHHIPRLMLLANQATQRGYSPSATNDWFIDAFVDGTPWVMPANVIGMGLFADGGRMSTKPYVAGGAYISRMSNYCGDCPFDPKKRTGDDACPFTAGYWNFLAKNEPKLRTNHRVTQPLANMRRLSDIAEVVAQEAKRDQF